MPMQPLTHHEIIGLVAPFTRGGRLVDLAASDRIERRLHFRPVLHDGVPALQEQLQLECLSADDFRLTRTLALAEGLQARLVAEGADVAGLLAQVDAVAPASQFRSGDGFEIALSHRIEPSVTAAAATILTDAVAHLAGLTLTLKVPRLDGMAADMSLTAAAGDTISLPDDLLAVLGWPWARLRQERQGWQGSLRLDGKGSRRSRDAEAKLVQTATHLVRTLSEPPARFHERLRRARFGVVLRRSIPLLVCLALIGAAALVSKVDFAPGSIFKMLIFNAPPLLLVLLFSLRELPVIEIPPWPRRSAATSWRPTTDPR
jgi:hypothetical protein